MRAIAGVDPALIAHHFGSQKGLFAEVMQLQCAQALTVDDVLAGDRATLPDRLIDAVTDLWEDADFRWLTAHGNEAAEAVREYLEQELLARLVEFLGGRDATARATAVVTILGGLIHTRYLNPLPTPAALTPSEARRMLAPALRAALAPRPRTATAPGAGGTRIRACPRPAAPTGTLRRALPSAGSLRGPGTGRSRCRTGGRSRSAAFHGVVGARYAARKVRTPAVA
ncbi:TetR/AcrR family transcriptional regulator [Streptomyces sp. NPDC087218]|uniref:TetR/AcrR family transcriptional regulator n=1 Tax=Streptomyces sp. NPDC087218 TaxID=3365769 RepID=UPI00381BF2D7